MRNTDPLISVVMPMYNSASYLSKSIESVLNQTYTNIELIIVDDFSTDNSLSIAQHYAEMDKRIKIFTSPCNQGPKQARDKAISLSSGEWIVNIDSDDTVEHDYIRKLWLRHLETNADYIGTTMCELDTNNNIVSTIPNKQFDYSVVYGGTEAMMRTLLSWEFSAGGALWRKTILSNLSTQNDYINNTDECDTRIHLNNCDKVAFVDAKYFYTQNVSSISRKVSVNSIAWDLYSACGLLDYFNQRYGKSSALSYLYHVLVAQLFREKIWSVYKLCVRSHIKLPHLTVNILSKAYNTYRNQRIKEHYCEVQFYRVIMALIRHRHQES